VERRDTRNVLFVLLSGYERGSNEVAREIELIHQRLFASASSSSGAATGRTPQPERGRVRRDLEVAARAGRLALSVATPPRQRVPRTLALVPPLGPSREVEETKTFFEVRFVDEIGEPISGLAVIVTADGKANQLTTDGSGKVRLDGARSSHGNVRVGSVQALRDIVEPRWKTARPGALPVGAPLVRMPLTDELSTVSLESELEHLVVVTPPLGKIFLELFDRSGRVRHAKREYTIEGPIKLSGVTDETGRLLHEAVLPGDYTLKLKLRFFEGTKDETVDEYESPLVVLGSEGGTPQQRMLGAVPQVVFGRARGFLFDTNKTFLLPAAVPALTQLRDLYQQNDPSELLIVGHTDTTGDASTNDPLSVARAKSMKAYLEDDVDSWLKNYDGSGKQKWGAREDRLMITALPDFPLRSEDEDLVEWFQRTRELTVDGKAGPETRKQLITEYMALDGASLKDDQEFHISITTHGAGQNFPLDKTGLELDQSAADEQEDPIDRRVELFFFDTDFGVMPKPGAAGGPEYLKWRQAALENQDFAVEPMGRAASVIEVHDALFDSDSAVVLPEPPATGDASGETVTSVSLFARTLRFAAEHPRKRLFIAGHTDTTASVDHNQKLSEERAKVALALLMGDRDGFVALANARHTVADTKRLLAFVTNGFADLDPGKGGFNCDPGKIDNDKASGVKSVKAFQEQYNQNQKAIGGKGGALVVDGEVGPLTWGAFFDALEFALARELGEEAAGVAELRQSVLFADDSKKALGFSEHHPADQVGRNNVRSQANRRVELLFFDEGEEPDLSLAASDPDISEVYSRGTYEHETIPVTTAKRVAQPLRLVSIDGLPLPGIEYLVTMDDGSERKGKLNAHGTAVIKAIADASFEVEYQDPDRIRATALAARLSRAIDDKDAPLILGVLGRSQKEFELIRTVSDEFFPRDNLIEALRAATRGSPEEEPVDYYLAGLGLGSSPGEIIAFDDPSRGKEKDGEIGVALA
jgi:outer membrane protein OmpA-like peptidoglycan-associated protein